MLECKEMFKYKTDKHGILQKYKTRLIIYSNQQQNLNFLIKAIILAIISLCILLTVTAKFDFKTL